MSTIAQPPAQPGSLRDPSLCRHEELLAAAINEVGTGYHDTMLYKCAECSNGIHVGFKQIHDVQAFWPAIKTIAGMLNHLGVGIPTGRRINALVVPIPHPDSECKCEWEASPPNIACPIHGEKAKV